MDETRVSLRHSCAVVGEQQTRALQFRDEAGSLVETPQGQKCAHFEIGHRFVEALVFWVSKCGTGIGKSWQISSYLLNSSGVQFTLSRCGLLDVAEAMQFLHQDLDAAVESAVYL